MLQRHIDLIEGELLPELHIESVDPHEPIVVHHVPEPWHLLGNGNYAAVLGRPDFPQWVVKVYAPGRPGIHREVEVYRRLGAHPAYSQCFHAGENYLVLKRLRGLNLYECLRRGIRIPESVVDEIDRALVYARRLGLHPHDVHAKNVMMMDCHGVVADVSDFLEPEADEKWEDFKRAYYRVYRPFLYRRAVPIPGWVLNLVRRSYRLFNRYFGSSD